MNPTLLPFAYRIAASLDALLYATRQWCGPEMELDLIWDEFCNEVYRRGGGDMGSTPDWMKSMTLEKACYLMQSADPNGVWTHSACEADGMDLTTWDDIRATLCNWADNEDCSLREMASRVGIILGE